EEASATKSELVESVRQLQATLQAMPKDPSLELARNQLQQQLGARRKQIGDLRLLGKHLDGALAAFERARTRQTTAEDGFKLAQQTWQSSRNRSRILRLRPGQDTLDEFMAQFQAAINEAQSQSEAIISKFRATLANAAQTSPRR
ncbi:unnamed protein product, partial [Prorocentrum cordatum]